jgi:hypothetical protein
MVHHHIKYKEIHGVDEVVLMDKGEHCRLHRRLRREGRCNIPPKELSRISCAANGRIGHNRCSKISDKEYERLQKFGFAGESINDALKRVLDIAEKNRKDTLPKE